MPSREKKLLIVGLSLALIPGIALLNLSCALYERLVYGAFWEEGRPKGLYLNSNADRPKLTPGVHLNGWRYDIKINSLGFRGKELGPKPQNGTQWTPKAAFLEPFWGPGVTSKRSKITVP